MAGVNKVILIGNLGADPEIKYLPSGSAVANLRLATTESYTTREGERVKQTEWHNVELWEGLAKIAEQYLKKGNSVYIEGKLKTESWQDSDGNTRSKTKIRGINLTLLGGRPQASTEDDLSNAEPGKPEAPPTNTENLSSGPEDLPF